MSELYALPALTPFVGPEEERAHFASPRYATDSTFRERVEAKLALSMKDAPAPPRGRNCMKISLGVENPQVSASAAQRIEFTDADYRAEADRQRLTAERDRLQADIDTAATVKHTQDENPYEDITFGPGTPRYAALSNRPFASMVDQMAAQGSAKYRNDPVVRAHIERRIALSLK